MSIHDEWVDITPFVGVYHINEWDHGYDGHAGFQKTRRAFYKDMNDMLAFLFDYINHYAISYFIAVPFDKTRQFNVVDTKNDIYKEMSHYLRAFKIRNDSRSGVKLSVHENRNTIEMLVEGAFIGISNLSLLFPEQKVLFAPNHHFGFTYFTQEVENQKVTVMRLLQNHENLRYYERAVGL